MTQNKKLDQRRAIITGGAQGIGKGIVHAFLTEGAKVVMTDWDEEAGKEAVREYTDEFGKGSVIFIKCNVAKEQEVMQLIDKSVSQLGGLDVLVNNAGLSEFKNILQISVSEFDRVLNVNLRAAFLMSKYAAPYLIDSHGSILNIASTRALMSEPDSEAYAASKGGLLSMTHALAISLGPHVRVNAISPGWIEVSNWKKSTARTGSFGGGQEAASGWSGGHAGRCCQGGGVFMQQRCGVYYRPKPGSRWRNDSEDDLCGVMVREFPIA